MSVEPVTKVDLIRERLANVRVRMDESARRAGRAGEKITLVAVSKTHPAGILREALEAGAVEFGENRVQEAEGKIAEIGRSGVRWHLIGHLQSNKARRAVRLFDLIHTIDSAALIERLERLCEEEGRETLDVLMQLDLAGEATKSGADEAEAPSLVEAFERCERVRCRGLMTLPPFFDDAERARPFFRRMRLLRDELGERGLFGERPGELSMGMSHDFETAIEEGATIVRVGTSIFGERAAR